MTQNIYDNDEFFQGYSRLSRSLEGLDGAPEWPALKALLPDVRGMRVLDLGCGMGWFCRWAEENGAARVTGVDVSENMLARARSMGGVGRIRYALADLEALEIEDGPYDLVYSSLALHYIGALDRLVERVHAALRPEGHLVFSAEHPIYTAPTHPGWVESADGLKTWPVDRYLEEGPRSTDWLAKGVIKQHRTIGTYVSLLVAAGFTILKLEEWGPSRAQVEAKPALAPERDRPPFLLMAARR